MIGAIVLAAGSSRRFGDDKRKATLPSGKFVLQQTLETTLNSFDHVLLALRYGDTVFEEELAALINNEKLTIYRAPESALGMGHSLANAIGQVRDWQGAFVFLGDMPFIQAATVEQLNTALADNPDAIVQPEYDGKPGHPVGFAASYFTDIASITGDQGAKPVLQENKDKVVHVAVDDEGVLQDVDTPEDI